MKLLRAAMALLMTATAAAAAGPGVALAGRMGDRALLLIDGQPQTLAVGQAAVAGVRLLRWADDAAVVERAGTTFTLRLGATPSQVGAAVAAGTGREIVLTAGPGGHFITAGSINGRPVRFMVDTGATVLALGRDDAQRLGLDLSAGPNAMTQTANGPVAVHSLMLLRVRVGDVELNNVQAVVVPSAMPYVLLGNSFLTRFQMRRVNDVMRLELR
jgi:aspartyl protease family protein